MVPGCPSFTGLPATHRATSTAGTRGSSGSASVRGGGKLALSFRERGLLHAYGIGIVPAILGGGIPLLAPHGELEKLTLTGCQSYPDGTVMLWYRKVE